MDIYTFAAYDATMLLIEAIRRAITQNQGQSFVGATGTCSFDANGDANQPGIARVFTLIAIEPVAEPT